MTSSAADELSIMIDHLGAARVPVAQIRMPMLDLLPALRTFPIDTDLKR